jgi:hypothetical protein
MRRSVRALFPVVMVSLPVVATVGAAPAAAHGGPGGGGGASASTLVTEAAKQLGVTRVRLVDAIVDAAVAKLQTAVKEGEITATTSTTWRTAPGRTSATRSRSAGRGRSQPTSRSSAGRRHPRPGARPRGGPSPLVGGHGRPLRGVGGRRGDA